MTKQLRIVLISVLTFVSTSVNAEEKKDEAGTTSETATESAQSDSAAASSEEDANLKAQIDTLKAETDAKFEAMQKEHDEQIAQLESSLMASVAQKTLADRFIFYGFFDLAFYRNFPSDDAMVAGMTTDATSFVLTNLNLYFGSKMTDSLSTLVELRFTFMPNGQEVSYGMEGFSEYERVDTTVNDPGNNKETRLGGLAIEQAHLTFKPVDWFGIVAGYYLTPYGIWNIDHGTPLLIPIREPYMQYSQIVPLRQLGLQFFGRAWPSDRFYIDYAITLSNGRGPMDSVQDLDENKASGLRLRGVFEGDNLSIGFGGYGYMGKYTDIERNITSVSPFTVEPDTTESYYEFIGALDLLLEFYGVRIQTEYIRKLIRYDERPPRSRMFPTNEYQPNYIHQSVYGLLAWTLPLEKWFDQMTLTPYVEVDFNNQDDTDENGKAIIFFGGINFKPSPHITLKTEGGMVKSIDSNRLDMAIAAAQMAVSF